MSVLQCRFPLCFVMCLINQVYHHLFANTIAVHLKFFVALLHLVMVVRAAKLVPYGDVCLKTYKENKLKFLGLYCTHWSM